MPNHHFVPQFILRKFIGDNNHIYKFSNKSKIITRSNSSKNIFYEENLYGFQNSDGTLDHKLETEWEKIETKAAQTYTELSKMLLTGNKIYLSKENIYNFICMQFKINPITLRKTIKENNIKIDFDFAKRVLANSNLNTSEYPSDDHIKSVLTEDNIKRLEQNANVLAMSDFDRKFVRSIFNKSICIGYIDDPRKSFLLGNYPFTPLGGSGLVHPESEHWIIIAPNIAIGLCNPMANMEIINPSVEMIRRMNQQTFDKSSEVVSNSEALLLSVSRNGQTSYRGKYQVKR